jgi:hypothetical protein
VERGRALDGIERLRLARRAEVRPARARRSGRFDAGDFGLSFEGEGLRARVQLQRAGKGTKR